MKLKLNLLISVFLILYNCDSNINTNKVNASFKSPKKTNNEVTNLSQRQFIEQLHVDNTQNENPLEVFLHFNYNTNEKQFLHIDVVNQFAVTCKMETSENEIKSLKLNLIEIKNNNKFNLKQGKYTKSTIDEYGVKTHHFNINIEDGASEKKDIDLNLNGLKNMKSGDIIDIHIKSKNLKIASYSTLTKNQLNKYKKNKQYDFYSNFGQHFCKSIVINKTNQ